MILFHLVILALIQGITEFLPISSSGHLLFAHHVLGHDAKEAWTTNLTLDVAVHVGTLFSVLLYFRADIIGMLRAIFMPTTADIAATDGIAGRTLALYIIIGSLPVILCGYALYVLAPEWVRSLEIMAWATIIFGIALGAADKFAPADKEIKELNLKNVLLIGVSQALALIPGTSRSGITMTTARALGYSRVAAAKFSLLLAIVAISGAGFLNGLSLILEHNIALGFDVALAALFSFLAGWAAIALMMKWLEKAGFMPFVIYRIALGLALLAFIYI